MNSMVPEDKSVQVADGSTSIVGAVQGLVIGDHNTVNQTFNITQHDAYLAQEWRALPAHWVERTSVANQAVNALMPGAVVALCGMGGSGKTALASRIASEVASRFPAGCFWIDLAAGEIDDALLRIALAFGHDISLLKSRDARAQTVRSLMAGKVALLVLDDAWKATDLDCFLPLPQSCAALLTTRDDSLAASVANEVIAVEELAPTEAAALLAKASGTPDTEPVLPRLAQLLGGLPLALELAGKLARQQARRPGFSWKTFADRFAEGKQRLSLGLIGITVRAAFDQTWTRGLQSELQRAFALLGIFPAGSISTAEITAAWNADNTQSLEQLNQLVDLSLIRPVDSVSIRLHPLLADYAREMSNELFGDEKISAHQRVADYVFNAAPRPPRTLSDISFVLRSHFHAASAGDHERAERVYPWFPRVNGEVTSDTVQPVAIPGFLIDHGQYQTHLLHERLGLELMKESSPWARSFAVFHVGEASMRTGELNEAEEYFKQAVTLIENEDGREIGLSKFLMALGQAQAQMGKLDEALASFQRSVDFDRKVDAEGGVVGAHSGALISMLGMADVLGASDKAESLDQANRICQQVHAEAIEHHKSDIAIMALTRLVDFFRQTDPQQSVDLLRQAKQIAQMSPNALAGRQGARYARLLGENAMNLATSQQPTLEDALDWLCLAIAHSGECEAWQELGYALYDLGNLLEHILINGEPPLLASWACYSLCESYLRETEGGSARNAQFRIDERIMPRIEESQRAEAAASVAADPWGLIDAALSPRSTGWRPAV